MIRLLMRNTPLSLNISLKNTGRLLLALGVLLTSNYVIPAPANASSKEPIRIILNNWTSQIVMAKIYGKTLESKGYNVEYKELSTKDQWARLHRGLEHVQVEVWEGTMAEDLERVKAKRQIVVVSDHDAKTREEWWYPSYVEQLCPGLPDWKA
ncbi:glycine betaine ABC transporter substrate-binding protein, partial [uncultured Kiloniella sp.]|uniref:glycine betaine ABC transporter substrate-binding protein n=1 Tax=uncultured Kiloniella sp. TaxID=1133091 RepID=UPI002638F9A2